MLQMQGYCLLTGADRAFVAALVPGPEIKVFTIHADRELFGLIEDGVRDFWKLVETDTPPDPTTEAEARQRFASHRPGATVELDESAAADLRELARVKTEIREREKLEQELRDRLIPRLADAEVVTFGGRTLATFKANRPSQRTDWQAVAAELKPSPELIEQYTRMTPGARVLRFTKETSV